MKENCTVHNRCVKYERELQQTVPELATTPHFLHRHYSKQLSAVVTNVCATTKLHYSNTAVAIFLLGSICYQFTQDTVENKQRLLTMWVVFLGPLKNKSHSHHTWLATQ